MGFLRNLVEQLRALWRRSSVAYRSALVAMSVLAVLTIAGVGWWSSRPQFMPLAKDLSPSEAALMVDKLQAVNIAHRLDFSGSTVLVPKAQWNEARLATRDVAPAVAPDSSLARGSILDDPTMNHFRVLREKERALEHSILRMHAIDSVDVHVALPEWTPFERDRKEPTASVVLGLRRSASFSPEQAATVAAMVAASVEGLSVEKVTVTDLEGRVLSAQGTFAEGGFVQQYEYRKRVEADLSAKAETMLAQMLGPGRAIVRVTADIDFTETERVEHLYDEGSQVKLSEYVTSKTTTRPADNSRGVAGVASNLTATAPLTAVAPISEDEESTDTQYAHATTTDTVRIRGGSVKRLTVAAMVDLAAASPDQTPVATPVDQQQIEKVVKQAVGFDTERGDQVEVLVTKLNGVIPDVDPTLRTLDRWELYSNLVRNASLGVAAVIALILGILLIRHIKPIALHERRLESLAAERSALLAELSAHAERNPEVVSRIVSSWLAADASHEMSKGRAEGGERSQSARRAA